MKTIHSSLKSYTLLFLAAVFSVPVTAQWTNLNPQVQGYFREISFASSQVAFAFVEGQSNAEDFLFKTVDGGHNWQEVTPTTPWIDDAAIHGLHFVDTNNGYAVLRAYDPSPTLKSFVYKTSDGGDTWVNVSPDDIPPGYGISNIYFADINNGFVTSGEKIFKTTDAGQSWTVKSMGNYHSPKDMDFYDANHGIIGTWDGTFAYKGAIYTTSDGGQTWDSLFLADNYTAIGSVAYTDNNTAYAMGEGSWNNGPKLYKTTDNGASWDTLTLTFLNDSMTQATDIHFMDANTGYLSTASGHIFRTTNGGVDWQFIHKETTPGSLVLFSNGQVMLAGGPLNTLLTDDVTIGIKELGQWLQQGVYPNPCKTYGTLMLKEPLSGAVHIYNLQGQEVAKANLQAEDQIPLQSLGLEQGLYLIQFEAFPGTAVKLRVD